MAAVSESFVGAGLAFGHRRLARLFRDVVAEQSVDSVLARVLATLRELVRCDDVVIWEATNDGRLAVAMIDGEDEEEMRSLRIDLGQGLTGKSAVDRASIVSNDAHIDPNAGYVPGTAVCPEAVACMPLVARDRLLGVLSLYRRGPQRAFLPEEIELVGDFAAMAALALDNAQTRRQLERLATTDELTGLANRRHFQAELEREVSSANRYKTPLSLLLVDLDDFKAINDSHGHTVGDRTLQRIASAIEETVRAPDVAARLGGDEFAILVAQADACAADQLARRIRERATQVLTGRTRTTISIGVATLKQNGDAKALIEQADQALYNEKKTSAARIRR